mmetsp:Transcript_16244/g.31748  ORF Transcript_16244/g.31748 Transcript_16244/m.31748 type:complete len:1001 (-) Transcript_16244:128-3130(-)
MNFEAYRPKPTEGSSCDKSTFTGPHANKFLSDCPSGGCLTFAALNEALDSCEVKSDCGGVVMRPENGDLPFELRKGSQLQESPTKEHAYIKKCLTGCKYVAFSAPHGGKTLNGCLEDSCKSYNTLSAAQFVCSKLSDCSGIVAKDNTYQLRTGLELQDEEGWLTFLKVCSQEEPTRKVVAVRVSGHTGIHSFRMGMYKIASTGERNVYKHESDNYFLYYSAEDAAWALGPKPGDSNVWIYLKSEAASPDQTEGSWSYYDGDSESWIEDAGMSIEAEEVELQGVGTQIKQESPIQEKFPPSEEGMWEESFGGHRDTKPRGPAAVGMDVTYEASSHVYGLAEHASPMALKNTVGSGGYSDPYRLYNLDVFEYELDVPMALYGAIPFITSHSERGTVGAFWLNSAETFVDIKDGARGKVSHWISESGSIDLFLLLGGTPQGVIREYSRLTGFQALPQKFSLAYHQCRWNYKDEADVKAVDNGFDEHDIPYDTLWLDIEHTDGKKYFTWDSTLFPDPQRMQERLKAKGRKMVTIIDPHIKRDNGYHVHKDAEAQGLYVKDASGSKPYEGWCWPGSVSYLDFFNPKTLAYWRDKFSFEEYKGSTDILYTWNDMNEPSVFNGPEVTMKKDALHWENVEHRDVHNLYGMQVAKGTWHGQAKRLSKRPFVLTRSFFAGSQRFGAMWTGDNKAEWSHLRDSIPMLLTMGICGFPFSGADVGGFFGDPDAELLLRWYQVGAFYPFFRGHGHIDTKRREPWLFGEPWTTRIRDAIRTRYRLLPYVYTLFYEASTHGSPVMRPLWMEFPNDASVWALDNEFMLGDTILVKPVTQQGANTASVYFPDGLWYDFQTFHKFTGPKTATVKAPIEKIPTYLKGGAILTTKERARRNSVLMENDPYTIIVAVDKDGLATGSIFLDDGVSLKSDSVLVKLEFGRDTEGSWLQTKVEKNGEYTTSNTVERIVIVGLSSKSSKARIAGKDESLEVEQSQSVITIRKPDLPIASEWRIQFS